MKKVFGCGWRWFCGCGCNCIRICGCKFCWVLGVFLGVILGGDGFVDKAEC